MNFKKIILTGVVIGASFVACKKDLDVQNPNLPTLQSTNTENGLINYTLGAVYINGFKNGTYTDGVQGYFFCGVFGMHGEMGDEVGEEAANIYGNQIGCPDLVTLDNGTKAPNPNSPADQYTLLRNTNSASQQTGNPGIQEWVNMYDLNNACNNILALSSSATFSGDAATKKSAMQAWAYWWKGYAYARIGSMYYAGLINNDVNKASNVYVTKEAIIAESNANLDKAAAIYKGLNGGGDYDVIMKAITPDFVQKGKGNVVQPAQFIRNINTLKARNILVNTVRSAMTADQWNSILTLTNAGIQTADNVLTGRTNSNGDVWPQTNGFLANLTSGKKPGDNTYKLSERLVQDFDTTDMRFKNNIASGTQWVGNSDRGNSFNTRFYLVNGGKALKNVITYSDYSNPGAVEFYLAGTYEENELMKAEAKIFTGDVDGGLASIDAVRTAQGAGLAATSKTGLTKDQAVELLRRERRIALAFRGIAFYDARRWGVTDKAGAGRSGCVVIDKAGKLSTNATINYNFLDYWDVPDNELYYNPAGAGSTVTTNPKK